MNRMFGDYQLREAAGYYWLIDMRQSGKEWRQPLRLNETGALLLVGFYEGRTPEELAGELAEHYELPPEEMKADVDAFLAQLATNGMTFV
ncbi:MAG: PqqD family protein [Lachnospiraceae bacterium]|nr:PqqD family protein [Lachnospiraceae bacterium]MDD7178488.1 PqqD family protein [bacterium]MDY5517414.1 PqqD family protein [Lachnospiraceae bacterium]